MKSKQKKSIRVALIISLLIIGGIIAAVAVMQSNRPTPTRQEEIYDKGQDVMPFDQEKTTHIFTNLDNGGDQKVVVKDQNDSENIRLIREHLREEQQKFQAGDLSDPAAIHGESMPGLNELKQAAKAQVIIVAYQELPDGAMLTYRTNDKTATRALHAWFDAQKSDHGTHAQ